jgi:methylated-DNA-[protein]-cysteine S-methyltransferase
VTRGTLALGGQRLRVASFPSPIGSITTVEDEGGRLLRVDFGSAEASPLSLSRSFGEPVELLVSARSTARRELEEYFAGKRRVFELAVDLSRLPPFHRRVLERLRRVPFGATVSYGKLADLVGASGAARAVGAAMRNNPIPIVVPCHRVLTAKGNLGGFTGGLDIKRKLLELEGNLPLELRHHEA